MEGNDIRIIITGILVTSMLLFGCPDYLHGDGILVAMTHHFFHVNLFHLAANLLSVWLIFRKGRRYGVAPFIAAYICATAAWYATDMPVAGVSNMIFALFGLRTPSLRDSWWRQRNVIVFICVTAGMALVPNISGFTHLASFILGSLCAVVCRSVKVIRSDYSRAAHNL